MHIQPDSVMTNVHKCSIPPETAEPSKQTLLVYRGLGVGIGNINKRPDRDLFQGHNLVCLMNFQPKYSPNDSGIV